MSILEFSFSDADVIRGRTPELVNPDASDLYKKLRVKFDIAAAVFLASHVGLDDDEFGWEGIRPLGEGSWEE